MSNDNHGARTHGRNSAAHEGTVTGGITIGGGKVQVGDGKSGETKSK
ncbi:hypothetical protein [Cryptosporangium phraense]|nr:hypothetical protein [Cryptosporangium phraense]